jgi:succinyl-diaminopimelate desuccinylase
MGSNQDRYRALLEGRLDEMVSLLRSLILIPTVKGTAKEEMPFGADIDRAYELMLQTADLDGFDTFDADRWGGHIEMPGFELDQTGEIIATADETLGIPVHLDVVPPGDGWVHEPFGGQIEDGKIYGRGTTDNKGAVVAVYAAMKALKDSGFIPRKNVRLILGLDEETGWIGMNRYLDAASVPDFGFAPDASFPAVNGEMGILHFELAKKLSKSGEKGIQLRSIGGGNAPNMVPDRARAVVLDDAGKGYDALKLHLAEYRDRTGYKINGKGVGKAFEITVKGISAHGAHPELGLNAISVLMDFLSELGIASESVREFIDFYNEHIGFELDGERMGIGFEDAPSGKLVFNAGMIGMDAEAVILSINVRYPVTMTEAQVYDAMLPLIHQYDLGIVKNQAIAPLYFPVDDPLIETLISIYSENTGDMTHAPITFGGGTFARILPKGVAFGPSFPGDPDLMHQAEECLELDKLMLSARIYADAIYRLAG